MRFGMMVLGNALVVLALIGFIDHGTRWLTATDLAIGLVSLGLVLTPDSLADRIARLLDVAPFAIAGALATAWIVALAVAATPWLTWWTFAFALGYVLLGAALVSIEPRRRSLFAARGPAPRTRG